VADLLLLAVEETCFGLRYILPMRSHAERLLANIQTAKGLAAANNGRLPTNKWLLANKYFGLIGAMRSHPEAYKDIPRERESRERYITADNSVLPRAYQCSRPGRRSHKQRLIDHVALARKLAEGNGGKIPTTTWLTANGHTTLLHALYKHPASFNIPRDKATVRREFTLQELVSRAERQAANGVMKSAVFRGRHAKEAVQEYPEAFAHIQFVQKHKSLEQHREDALKLAKENGGLLPAVVWLQHNGWRALDAAMRTSPKLFKDIPQETRWRRNKSKRLRFVRKTGISDAEEKMLANS
jgi:hypothetical protein